MTQDAPDFVKFLVGDKPRSQLRPGWIQHEFALPTAMVLNPLASNALRRVPPGAPVSMPRLGAAMRSVLWLPPAIPGHGNWLTSLPMLFDPWASRIYQASDCSKQNGHSRVGLFLTFCVMFCRFYARAEKDWKLEQEMLEIRDRDCASALASTADPCFCKWRRDRSQERHCALDSTADPCFCKWRPDRASGPKECLPLLGALSGVIW